MTQTLRCPVCRADNNLGTACRRCRADLSLLTALEQERERLLAQASELLAASQPGPSLARAEQATALRSGADSWRAQAVGHMLLGSFPEAWRCYLLARKHADA